MSWRSVAGSRLRALFRRDRLERELDDEVRFHLEMQADDNMRAGMEPDEARRTARRSFGGRDAMKETYRERRGLPVVETIGQDVRYALRMLRQSPGFTAVAVVSLAIGIGVNTTIFTLVNAALLKSLPLQDASRLVSAFTTDERNPQIGLGTSWDNYLDYRDGNAVFDQLAASAGISVSVASGTGEPERVSAELVSGNFFGTLGTPPLVGRGLLPEDDRLEGAKLVTVLAYTLWQTRFGGDRSIVGRTILVNNRPFLVVGVMPAAFRGTTNPLVDTALWVPYMTNPVTTSGVYRTGLSNRRFTAFTLTGRLKTGMTRDAAEANLKSIARRLAAAYPEENGGRSMTVRGVGAFDPSTNAAAVMSAGLLMTIVGLVLSVACINVANLLLARMTVRQREIAIRQSIGATRARLIRQFFTEGLLLAGASSIAGLFLAKMALPVLWAFRPSSVDAAALDLHVDLRVLGFTVVLSLVTCVLFALAPAIKASRPDVVAELKGRGVGAHVKSMGLRHVLIAAQIALSLVSLISAGLFVRSLQHAERMDPGFALDQLAMMNIDLGAHGYSEAQGRVFQRQAFERASALGGVDSVVLADLAPLWGGGKFHDRTGES